MEASLWTHCSLLCVCVQPTSGALYSEDDFVIMTTTEKEKYKCLLPSLTSGDEVRRMNTFWISNSTLWINTNSSVSLLSQMKKNLVRVLSAWSLSSILNMFDVFYSLRMTLRSTVDRAPVNCWSLYSNEAAVPTGWEGPSFFSAFVWFPYFSEKDETTFTWNSRYVSRA